MARRDFDLYAISSKCVYAAGGLHFRALFVCANGSWQAQAGEGHCAVATCLRAPVFSLHCERTARHAAVIRFDSVLDPKMCNRLAKEHEERKAREREREREKEKQPATSSLPHRPLLSLSLPPAVACQPVRVYCCSSTHHRVVHRGGNRWDDARKLSASPAPPLPLTTTVPAPAASSFKENPLVAMLSSVLRLK